MLFNSYEFIIVYLPLVFIGFFCLAKYRKSYAALWLAAASVVFYGYWDPRYVPLLIISVVFNYGLGFKLSKTVAKIQASYLLASGIFMNLSLLFYFKYADFFISTVNLSVGTNLPLLNIVLPLGISFFTFTQIAFLVDVKNGKVREYNFVHYLLFVTYFPHLIAGPVLHHAQMMPQFGHDSTYRLQRNLIATGLAIFTLGLAKKIFLADNLSEYVGPVFDNAAKGMMPQFFLAWASALAYTFQLYFDFSGYSDMAIGLSLLFGINLPINFNSPYKSKNISEFWRRWHMTLSQFLRDYLYIPLGGNRQGAIRRYINLMLTMLLGGLWHGANWTFVIWGGLHGVYLVINSAWQRVIGHAGISLFNTKIASVFSVLLTFTLTVIAWVYFRADSLQAANLILGSMFGLQGWEDKLQMNRLRNLLLFSAAIVFLLPNTQELIAKAIKILENLPAKKTNFLMLVAGSVFGSLFSFLLLMLARKSEFLYFQF